MSHPRRTFERIYGQRPQVVWWAPGRVNLVGEHTDYNDGFVLPFALQLGVAAAVRRRPDGLLRIASAQLDGPGGSTVVPVADLRPGAVAGWGAYVAGTVWALRDELGGLPGVDVLVDGTVPEGAGLSSSAALACSTAGALLALVGAEMEPLEVARLARRAENDFVGMPCGIMDQVAAVLGRADHALFLDTRTLAVEHVPLALQRTGLEVLVVDTGVHHALADGQYAARRDECRRAAAALGVEALRDVDDLPGALARLDDPVLARRVRHVATEDARVLAAVDLLRSGRVDALGPLLDASHASLRDDFEVSCAELDLTADVAREAGALGARMVGAGFGGSVLALVRAERSAAVDAAVRTAFDRRSLAAPRIIPAWPSGGYGEEPAGM